MILPIEGVASARTRTCNPEGIEPLVLYRLSYTGINFPSFSFNKFFALPIVEKLETYINAKYANRIIDSNGRCKASDIFPLRLYNSKQQFQISIIRTSPYEPKKKISRRAAITYAKGVGFSRYSS